MDTIKVRKANSILTVPAIDKASYLAKGYDVLGENGNVVEECLPNDTATLQAKYLELVEENKKLREELEDLKAKKSISVPSIPKVKVIPVESEKEVEAVVEEKPKKTVRSKTKRS